MMKNAAMWVMRQFRGAKVDQLARPRERGAVTMLPLRMRVPIARKRTTVVFLWRWLPQLYAIARYIPVYVVEARRHGEDAHLLHAHLETNLRRPKRHIYRKQTVQYCKGVL